MVADDNLKPDEEMIEALTSIKQRKFVIFYVENGFNGTAAAEAAGYAKAAASAYDCLKNPAIKEQIKRYASLCARNVGESRETILEREVNWANVDPGDFFTSVPLVAADGTPVLDITGEPVVTREMKPMEELTKAQRQCIKKLSSNRHGPVLEFHDPMRANRNLAEYNGMLSKEDQALSADDAANLIGAAMARMEELDHTPATSE